MSSTTHGIVETLETDIIAEFEKIKTESLSSFQIAIGATGIQGESHGTDPSPLSHAVRARRFALARYLIREGALLFQGYPSHIAASDGCTSYFELLREIRGEAIAAEHLGWQTDDRGMTALASAAAASRLEFVQWAFAEYGTQILARWELRHCEALLRAAAQSGSVDVVTFLFSAFTEPAYGKAIDAATVSDWAAHLLIPAAEADSLALISFALRRADPARRSYVDSAAQAVVELASRKLVGLPASDQANTLVHLLSLLPAAVAREVCCGSDALALAVHNTNAYACALLIDSGADACAGLRALLFDHGKHVDSVHVLPASAAAARARATVDAVLTRIRGVCPLVRLRGDKAACAALSAAVCDIIHTDICRLDVYARESPTSTLLHILPSAAATAHLPVVELLAVLLEHHSAPRWFACGSRVWRLFQRNSEAAYQAKTDALRQWDVAVRALVERGPSPAPMCAEPLWLAPGSNEASPASSDLYAPFDATPLMPEPPPLAGSRPYPGRCVACHGRDGACARGCAGRHDHADIALARVAAVLVPLAAAAHAEAELGGLGAEAAIAAVQLGRPNVLWVLHQTAPCSLVGLAADVFVRATPFALDAAWRARLALCARVLLSAPAR